MIRLKMAAAVMLAALCLWFGAVPTQAQQEMTFQVRSNYPYKVQISFYSESRNHSWPGPGRAYNLDDSQVHSYRLACQNGEKICYGAWVTGNATQYWGVGNNKTQRCSNCCYTCNGGATQLINLNR